MRLNRVSAALLVAAACTDYSAWECKDVQQQFADKIQAHYETLSRACTEDRQCQNAGAMFDAKGNICFNQCDSPLTTSEPDAFRDFVTNDVEIQLLCDQVVSDGCHVDSGCPFFSSGMCLNGQCTVPHDVDLEACNAEVYAVYQAATAYVDALASTCQTAHDAGCLARFGYVLCPRPTPTCLQGRCVEGF